ncbi:hypothetical protein BVX93_02370 [bacterium B13(2017)]|nr:hypothetical protein BVX93_02370 [bacterium B13(2017)]
MSAIKIIHLLLLNFLLFFYPYYIWAINITSKSNNDVCTLAPKSETKFIIPFCDDIEELIENIRSLGADQFVLGQEHTRDLARIFDMILLRHDYQNIFNHLLMKLNIENVNYSNQRNIAFIIKYFFEENKLSCKKLFLTKEQYDHIETLFFSFDTFDKGETLVKILLNKNIVFQGDINRDIILNTKVDLFKQYLDFFNQYGERETIHCYEQFNYITWHQFIPEINDFQAKKFIDIFIDYLSVYCRPDLYDYLFKKVIPPLFKNKYLQKKIIKTFEKLFQTNILEIYYKTWLDLFKNADSDFQNKILSCAYKIAKKEKAHSDLFSFILTKIFVPLAEKNVLAGKYGLLLIEPFFKLNISDSITSPEQACKIIYENLENAKLFFKYSTLLRLLFPFTLTQNDPRPPLKYAKEEDIVINLGKNLYMTPISESFRRHIIFSVNPNGLIKEFAFETIIPGEWMDRIMIAVDKREAVANEIINQFPDQDYTVKPIYKKIFEVGTYELYGEKKICQDEELWDGIWMRDLTLPVMAFSYKDGKRLEFIAKDALDQISHRLKWSNKQLETEIATQVANLVNVAHSLGYVGRSSLTGTDQHIGNFRLIEEENGIKIIYVGDFEYYRKVGPVTEENEDYYKYDLSTIIKGATRFKPHTPGLADVFSVLSIDELDKIINFPSKILTCA